RATAGAKKRRGGEGAGGWGWRAAALAVTAPPPRRASSRASAAFTSTGSGLPARTGAGPVRSERSVALDSLVGEADISSARTLVISAAAIDEPDSKSYSPA